MRQVSYIAVQVASEVKAQNDVDKEDGDSAHAAPTEVPDTRIRAVPEEVSGTMTNAAPGSCAGIVQGNSGAPMTVPGSGLRATSGKVSGCSTPWALEYWLSVCLSVSTCLCLCACLVSVCVWVCVCLWFLGAQHCHMPVLKVLT